MGLGERVGTELRIHVYLHEAAVTRPDCINLTDFHKTPTYRAVPDVAQWYLQLDNFQPGIVLENRLNE